MSLILKLNVDLKGHKKGDIITISSIPDEEEWDEIPTDIYWRRRLKDAAVDNCVEIYSEEESDQEKYIEGDEVTKKHLEKRLIDKAEREVIKEPEVIDDIEEIEEPKVVDDIEEIEDYITDDI